MYVVSSQQRVFDSQRLREVVAKGHKPESTPVEVTELPIVTTSGVEPQGVDPIRAPARRAHARYVLVGKPHIVGEIAAVYRQKLL